MNKLLIFRILVSSTGTGDPSLKLLLRYAAILSLQYVNMMMYIKYIRAYYSNFYAYANTSHRAYAIATANCYTCTTYIQAKL